MKIPCRLPIFRTGEDLIMIKLLIPRCGTVAWVPRRSLTIVEQSATTKHIRGLVEAKLLDEDSETYFVQIQDRGGVQRLWIPKDWIRKELG